MPNIPAIGITNINQAPIHQWKSSQPIHGLGGFSARDIKQGEVFAGNNFPDFRGYNHSECPNFQLRRINGVHREIALRDLAEGEEITVDYYDVGNEDFWIKP